MVSVSIFASFLAGYYSVPFINGGKTVANGIRNARIVIEVMGKDSTKGFRSLKQSLGEIKNLIGSLEQAMQPNINFEAEMSRVKAITGAVGQEFKDLERLAKTLGSSTYFSGVQAAEGIRFLGMAGLQTDDIFKVLPSTLNLARVGMIDLGRAADIATNIHERDESSGGGSAAGDRRNGQGGHVCQYRTSKSLGEGCASPLPGREPTACRWKSLLPCSRDWRTPASRARTLGMKLRTWMQYMVGPTENMRKSIDHVAQEMIRSGKATEDYNLVFTETDGKLRNLVDVFGRIGSGRHSAEGLGGYVRQEEAARHLRRLRWMMSWKRCVGCTREPASWRFRCGHG